MGISKCDIQHKMKKTNTAINWHTVRTSALIAIMVVIGGLQSLNGTSLASSGALDSIIAVLLFVEHQLAGNSSPIK